MKSKRGRPLLNDDLNLHLDEQAGGLIQLS